jgi:hypothetical protein
MINGGLSFNGGGGGSTKSILIRLITADNGDLEGGITLQEFVDRVSTKVTGLIASTLPENQRYKGQFSTFADFENSALYASTILSDYVFIASTNELYRLESIGGGGVKNWVSLTSDIKTKLDALEAFVDDTADVDSIVNKVAEVLKVFENYPEGVNILQEFNNIKANILLKANSSDVYTKTEVDLLLTAKVSKTQTINGVALNGNITLTKTNFSDLNNVDNTSDLNKPISTATQNALDLKVDKVVGMGLSTNDYSNAEKLKLAGIQEEATKNDTDANLKNRANHTGTQLANTISDFQIEVSLNQDVIDSKDAKHTHLNKALLDTYNQTNLDISDAVAKKHTHANLTILDNTTASFTIEDETKLDGIDLSTKQNLIPRVASEVLMLALQNLTVGYIVARTDVSALFQLKALPSNQLQNWEVLVSTGGSVSIPSTAVERVYTSGALPSLDGYYAYNGGTMPAGSVGDILKLENSVWTVDQTFINAPASIYSKLDGKTYNKKINSSGVKTWAVATEPAIYEARNDGDNTKIGGFTSIQGAVDQYTSDRLAGLVSVGVIHNYIANSNESVTIDTENLALIGFGTGTRSQNLISRIILGANSHRITIKDTLISAGSLIPLTILSAGTTTESGGSTGRGKHILSGVSTSTSGTTAVQVSNIDNFISFENSSDFGNKIINFANKTGSTQAIYIEGVKNANFVIGNGYIVSKSNSYTVYISSISASSYLLDLDSAKPTAYSLIRMASALGIPTSVRAGTLIINDDVGGSLANLKCNTTYTVLASIPLGTAIDLTKYTQQTIGAQINDTTASSSSTYSSNKINTELATKENTITTLPIAKGGTNSSTALTNDKVIISEDGKIIESSTTKTQLSYLDATSSIQTQINAKANDSDVVKLTTNQSISGDKIFNDKVLLPNTSLTSNVIEYLVIENNEIKKQTLAIPDKHFGNSTDSRTITNSGSLTFTIETGLFFYPLQDVIVYHNNLNHMHGQIISYNSATGETVIDITNKTGSGTYSSWKIYYDGATSSNVNLVDNLTTQDANSALTANQGYVLNQNKVDKSVKINNKNLSTDINLELASSDFANQGTATTVLHGNASGNPSFSQINTSDIANNAITNAKLAQVATQTIKGRLSSGTGNVEDITVNQFVAMLPSNAIPNWISVGSLYAYWGATTTAPTQGGTIYRNQYYYRQIGTKAYETTFGFDKSAGGTAGNGDYLFSLPGNLPDFDTSLPFQAAWNTDILANSNIFNRFTVPLSYGNFNHESLPSTTAQALIFDARRFRVIIHVPGTAIRAWGSAWFAANGWVGGTFTMQYQSI